MPLSQSVNVCALIQNHVLGYWGTGGEWTDSLTTCGRLQSENQVTPPHPRVSRESPKATHARLRLSTRPPCTRAAAHRARPRRALLRRLTHTRAAAGRPQVHAGEEAADARLQAHAERPARGGERRSLRQRHHEVARGHLRVRGPTAGTHALPRRCSSIAPPAHRLHLSTALLTPCPLHTGPRTPRGRTARSS